MSNDGSSTKMIDQSYEDQAVQQVRMKSNIVFGRNLTTQSIVQSRQDRPDFCEKRARQYTVASKVLLKMKTLCNLRILKKCNQVGSDVIKSFIKLRKKTRKLLQVIYNLGVRNDLFSEKRTQLTYRRLATQVQKIRFTVALGAQ